MTQTDIGPISVASMEEIQQGWFELKSRVAQLEAEKGSLEKENKALRFLLEKVIEHRQKSHGELVLLLTSLVSRLPISDVGVLVSKLVEHNTHVSEICSALTKGALDAELPQPQILKALDQAKRDLRTALKAAVEELIRLDPPLESDMLRSLIQGPDLFFSPGVVRADRCFVKGQIPRERVLRDFGEDALVFFNDMTTDAKRNPRPKPDEIALAFKSDFEAALSKAAAYAPEKREQLLALFRRVQRSKAHTEEARLQRNAFHRLSFILELLHYYEHQNTESPELAFAQRLPALIEQIVLPGSGDSLEEKWIVEAETLLRLVPNPDYRLMILNNIGKGGGAARHLKYVLKLRTDKIPDQNETLADYVRYLIPPPPQKPPPPQSIASMLRLLRPEVQLLVARGIVSTERLLKEEAESLGKAVGKELGLTGLEVPAKAVEGLPAELERRIAWEQIKDSIARRADPTAVAAAIRDRLRARYDADEMKQSWVTLTEADPISLIRVFCQLPYLADGRTDSISRTLMESYVSRLTHEKYAGTYQKVVNSLRNMFKANPNSPTLVNFLALVRWVDPAAADKVAADIGMPVVSQ